MTANHWASVAARAAMAALLGAVVLLGPLPAPARPPSPPGPANAIPSAAQAAQVSAANRFPPSCVLLGTCRSPNVVTQHNDNARTGAQLDETALTPANVNASQFGYLYDRHVLGPLLAQPLYVRGVQTPQGAKNLMFIATGDDVIYAFDADDQSADLTTSVPNPEAGDGWHTAPDDVGPMGYAPPTVPESTKWIWRTALGGRPPLPSGWTPPDPHVSWQNKPHDLCDETVPHVVGVTSTPVIDVSAGVLYVVSREQHGATDLGHDYLHALDLGTGAILRTRQIGNTPQSPGESVITRGGAANAVSALVFNDQAQRQRPGLLLQGGLLYLGYGTYTCDQPAPNGDPYRGWVLAYHAADFSPAGAFTNSASSDQAGMGIWQSGNGLAGAGDGSVFYMTGNDIGPGLAPLGDAFVRLTGDGSSLQASSVFQARLNASNPPIAQNFKGGDTDLGSGGPVILPGGKLVGGGKDGRLFVLNQTGDLQTGYTSFQAFYNTFHLQSGQSYPNASSPYYNSPLTYPSQCPPAGIYGVANESQPCWIDPGQYANGESFGPNIHTAPVFWRTSSTHGFLYKMPEKDYLKAFDYNISTGAVAPMPAHVATARPAADGMPGGFSSVSANGTSNGIVWTVAQQANSMMGYPQPAILYAHDASNLNELWNNGADSVTLAKFTAPTIADGRVFLPSVGLFQVYGLRPRIRLPNVPIYYPWPIIVLPPEQQIARKWSNEGGPGGLLGMAISEVRKDGAGGLRQDYARFVAGGGYGQVSTPPGAPILMAMEMPDKDQPRVPPLKIEASIFASPSTSAHFVMGEIRRYYLEVGGPLKIGYPITDETPTPDGLGRMSRFERGTIFWYPGHAAEAGDPVPPRLEGTKAPPMKGMDHPAGG